MGLEHNCRGKIMNNKQTLWKLKTKSSSHTLLKKWSSISTNKWMHSKYANSLSVISTQSEKNKPAYRLYIILCVRNCKTRYHRTVRTPTNKRRNNSDNLRATESEPRRRSITSINNRRNNKLHDNQNGGEKIDLDEIGVLRVSVYDESMNLKNWGKIRLRSCLLKE